MTPITPSDLSEREFPKSIRGYKIAEVDAYIDRITENYSELYRENIELAKKVSELEAKLAAATKDEETARQTLETAKKASDTMIEEAYVRADHILASIKASCDSILKNFRDKIETQKNALSEIQQNVLTFKNELFEKYRLHIELIEQISPVYEYEEELSPEEYAGRVVTELKREVAAQYGISLDSLAMPDAMQTRVVPTVAPVEEAVEIPAVKDEPKPATPKKTRSKKKKTTSVPSVMELLDEYEDPDVLRESKNKLPHIHQFMLDIDGAPENGELVLSKK